MIKVGVIGGAGYTAGELLRILLHHPQASIVYVHSNSQAGKPVAAIHHDLEGETTLQFTDTLADSVDVAFLCLGHGKSVEFLTKKPISPSTKIIDLSQDFRLKANSQFQKDRAFVYGLPELQKDAIANSDNVANPGCFATAIQLALLPLAAGGHIHQDVHINAITGSTGAGQSPTSTTHFSWRNNNVSVYKAFSHQHLNEIGESLNSLQNLNGSALNFIPVRGNFARGIFATAYTKCSLSEAEAKDAYQQFYKGAAFTHVSDLPIHLKQVVNTNKCLLHVAKHGENLMVTSIIDNLAKGASGQAVQNMNLMFGLDENVGLRLKSTMH